MIFLHISNGSEIPLMSVLKLLVDTFVSFLEREVIIISLRIENMGNLDLSMIIKRMKKKKKKKKSVKLVQ